LHKIAYIKKEEKKEKEHENFENIKQTENSSINKE